jgi:DNA-binding NarL/FixJ family response regulator
MKPNNCPPDKMPENKNPPKALIVDDNSMLRETTRTFLESKFPGLCVLEAQDGKEAFQQTHNHRPDLILMDIGLPGENGLRLTRKIKNLYPQITIIIFTNYDLSEYRQAAFDYGADFFFSKSSTNRRMLTAAVEPIVRGLIP